MRIQIVLLIILLYIIKLEYHFTDCLYSVILLRCFHFNFSISSDLLFVYFVLFSSCFLFYKSFCIHPSIDPSIYLSIYLSSSFDLFSCFFLLDQWRRGRRAILISTHFISKCLKGC